MDPSEFAERCAGIGLDYVAMMLRDEKAAFAARRDTVTRAARDDVRRLLRKKGGARSHGDVSFLLAGPFRRFARAVGAC